MRLKTVSDEEPEVMIKTTLNRRKSAKIGLSKHGDYSFMNWCDKELERSEHDLKILLELKELRESSDIGPLIEYVSFEEGDKL